uniref:Protein cereblon-like isoform X4 n=1 Tax=Cicer arietinum TaxID=3827 RepID=A0A3Q7Y6S5_CICAR|nr:protein cereblon-like isoform X4 [Cicer arietinum]
MEENDRRILEREMYQIEQIRQLDLEELQVEEVDDFQNSSDDDDNNNHRDPTTGILGEFTYNICVASLHSYLGDVEDTHHRTAFLDGGAVLNLPLFCLQGVVLFPGATLPLRVIESNFVAAVERSLSRVDVPYTIGVIRVYSDTANHSMKSASIGTTAEVFLLNWCTILLLINCGVSFRVTYRREGLWCVDAPERGRRQCR